MEQLPKAALHEDVGRMLENLPGLQLPADFQVGRVPSRLASDAGSDPGSNVSSQSGWTSVLCLSCLVLAL